MIPDDLPFSEEEPRIELYIFVADDEGEYWYKTNHRFAERPGIGTVKALLDEAKQHFASLYPGIEAGDFSVEIAYIDGERQTPSHRSSRKS